ncbi:hypothetical protein RB601_009210 [Gaeumannomyces tritici]
MDSRRQDQGQSRYRGSAYPNYSDCGLSEEPEPIGGDSVAYNEPVRGSHTLGRCGPKQYSRDFRSSFSPVDHRPNDRTPTDGQSLREWLDQNRAPDTPEEIRQLWPGLARLCRSLGSPLTGCRDGAQFGAAGADVRHDVTPANIFFVSSPYDSSSSGGQCGGGKVDVKLGDPGWSRQLQPMPDLSKPYPWSPSNYVAPKQFIGHGNDAYVGMTSSSTDLWSMSCLMLEVAVWLGGGTQAAAEFFRTRVHKKEQSDRFPTSPSIVGYEGCFHNGEETLTSVKGIAVPTNRNQWVFDGITGRIVDSLVENILVNAKQRPGISWTARSSPIKPYIQQARADSGVNWGTDGSIPRRLSTKSDNFKSPPQAGEQTRVPLVRKPPKHSEATSTVSATTATLGSGHGSLISSKSWNLSLRTFKENSMDVTIDMIEHEGQLKRALEAIVKVVKHVDRYGLEVWFTSAPPQQHQASPGCPTRPPRRRPAQTSTS